MTFLNQSSASVRDDDLYIDWQGSKFRIDMLEFIDTIEWNGDLVTRARGICQNARFDVVLKYSDYINRLNALERMGRRAASLPKRMVVA